MWTKRAAQSDPIKRAQAEELIREIAEAERVLLDPGSVVISTQRPGQAKWPAAVDSPPGKRDWLPIAKKYFGAGKCLAAVLHAAREAIGYDGANHEAWAIRANSSFVMGNYRDAGFEFREAIGLRPDNPEYHFELCSRRFSRSEAGARP